MRYGRRYSRLMALFPPYFFPLAPLRACLLAHTATAIPLHGAFTLLFKMRSLGFAAVLGEGSHFAVVNFCFTNRHDPPVCSLPASISLPPSRRQAVVAFRGTEQSRWKDFATDLNLAPASLNAERVDSNEGLPFTLRVLRAVVGPADEVMVHKGFLSAYDSLRTQVRGSPPFALPGS